MSEHTKGKWEAEIDGKSTSFALPNGEVESYRATIFHIEKAGKFAQKQIICRVSEIAVGTLQANANARLIAAVPSLLRACKDFTGGWGHFLDCIDFNHSNLDADAIRFMNEVPGKIEQAAIAAAEKG